VLFAGRVVRHGLSLVLAAAFAAAPRAASAEAPLAAAAPVADPHPEWADLPEEVREQLACEDRAAHPTPAILETWRTKVPPSFLLRARAVGGVYVGGDSRGPAPRPTGADNPNTGLDVGWQAGAAATLALLHPLQLDGALRYFHGGSSSMLQADVTAGFAFRTYGERWVKAGATAAGGVVHSWDSHCQTRRKDWVIQGGLKLLHESLKQPSASRSIPALQVGLSSHHLAGSAVDFSIAGLWAPGEKAYGGQVSFGASRTLIAIHVPVDWLYTSMNMGALVGHDVSLWWMTLDLGVAFER
jgi:hypothetical protein